MARDSDHLAGFETENTGGLLSGLLAEEDVFDRRSLWRLGSWGVASVGAVIVALYANHASVATRRDQVASADLARQSQQIQFVAKESQSEARRLASAIETLNDDRDRLYSRVTTLEQGLESVTGAISKQAAATASPPPAAPAATAPAEAPSAAKSQGPAPAVAPVATMAAVPVVAAAPAAKTSDKELTDSAAPEQAPAAVSSIAKTPIASTSNASASNTPVAPPLVAAKSMMAPPDAAAAKLIEPEKPPKIVAMPMPKAEVVAAAPPADETEADALAAAAPKLAVQRTEFGVDVGGANSVGGLRALWRGLLKSRANAALTTLRPIIVIREGTSGLGMQLRLVAGPLADAAAAAKICAGLAENERPCETAVFDGQRLSMNGDEPAATAKPAADKPAVAKPPRVSTRHRTSSRRQESEEPPKPDPPSRLSAFFSRR